VIGGILCPLLCRCDGQETSSDDCDQDESREEQQRNWYVGLTPGTAAMARNDPQDIVCGQQSERNYGRYEKARPVRKL